MRGGGGDVVPAGTSPGGIQGVGVDVFDPTRIKETIVCVGIVG